MNNVTIEYDAGHGEPPEAFYDGSFRNVVRPALERAKIIISGSQDDLEIFMTIIGAVGELVQKHNKEMETLVSIYEKELEELRMSKRKSRRLNTEKARKVASLKKRLANAQKKLAAIHDRRLLTKGSERVRMHLFNRYVSQRDLVESLQAEIATLESSEKS